MIGMCRSVLSRFSRIFWYSLLWCAILVFCLAAQIILLEGVLRLSGYGESTRFLIRREVDGTAYFTPNRAFYQQFTSLPLDRIMTWDDLDFQVPEIKERDAYRIFVFGGSAIYGTRSSARILEMMLRDAVPSVPWEVYNVACPGMNSHVMFQAARACTLLEPDMFLVYMGNNEAVGPFGPATMLGQSDLLWRTPVVRMLIAANALRTVQLFRSTGAVTALNLPDNDALMRMLPGMTDNPRTLDLYDRNVSDICAAAESTQARVLLCTLIGNRRFMGHVAEAEVDAGPGINGVLRTQADLHGDVYLADVAGAIAAHSKEGLPGYDYFVDNVHFNFAGNYIAASALFETVLTTMQEKDISDAVLPTKDRCAEMLAWTSAAEYDLLNWQLQAFLDEYSRQRVQQRHTILKNEVGDNWREQLLEDYRAALRLYPADLYLRQTAFRQAFETGDSREAWVQSCELSAHHPASRSGLRVAGMFAEMDGKVDDAIFAYGECLRIYPDDPEVLRRLAELLFLNGDRNAAEPLYRRYLHIDSTDAFAWCRIGEIQAGQGKKKKAAATWKSIIAEVPNHPLAYRLLDVLMAEEKSIEERIALWDTLSEKYPEAAEPLVRRALLYDAAAEEEALLLLRRAVVLVPGDSVIHYHLGIAAYHQGMFEESAAAFREALRLNPSDPRNVRWLEKVLAEKT